MKILRIGGRNLASLAGDFCVDFEQEPLASSGLFAISGPTGAGKSTLLDALCLALYSDTPRLLKAPRTGVPDSADQMLTAQDVRSLLRRGTAEGYAEVDFVGNDNARYRARWSVKRAYNKAAGAMQGTKMSLHRLPELTPIGGTLTETLKEIAARIGLTFDQFTRAVLLAQNEFSAFLRTDENERGELLETLTGSAVYSDISKRAYLRFKDEEQKSKALQARLADQTPLSADERAAIEAQAAAAHAAMTAVDARKALVEQQLRWRQEADRLAASELQAQQALTAANAELDAAAGRRAHVAAIEAAAPARPLVADIARLAAERSAAQTAIAEQQASLQQAVAAQQTATLAVAAAQAELQAAEKAQIEAAPILNRARALDASIEALLPSHQQAMNARGEAQRELAAALDARAAKTAALERTRSEHAASEAWLAAQRHLEPLAAQWPRWDRLFAQAAKTADLTTSLGAELARAQGTESEALAAETKARTAAADVAERLAAADIERQRSIAALAVYKPDQLHAERQSLEQRRELLAAHARRAEQEAARGKAQARLDAALAAAGPLAGAADQAERSLKAAELACADRVEHLRSNLVDGEPCPVCGSAEHPYHQQDERLHAMLDSLRAQLASCREQSRANFAEQASQRTIVASCDAQLAKLPAQQAGDGPDADTVQARLAQLEHELQAAHLASSARDAAQSRYDALAAEGQRLQSAATTAHTQLASASTTVKSTADKRSAAQATLAALLEELDGVIDGDWQAAWRAAPAQYRDARAAEALQWSERSALHAQRAATLAKLDIEVAGAAARFDQAERGARAADTAFSEIDAKVEAHRQERRQLWEGKAVADIEAALAGAVKAAKTGLDAQQQAGLAAGQAETRAREHVAHLTQRLAAIDAEAVAASARRDAWLRDAGHIDAATLERLLQTTDDWTRQERAALQLIDAQAARAATVLAERRAQREQHLATLHGDDSADALAEKLRQVDKERGIASDAWTALRLQLAQDDERRQKAQAMMALIETQQSAERRWGRLNELIGSADGKKFRNYAQQFTLDVLLGYANSHLADLAKRYRLERVASAAGPSLGLMVRDRDMGGEVRSVNSLSGGESFLVSLALALGLASLSSNRVRVESLFIDEGFGSLDSDTLRVAMDALDGLQSMGRKVGVISHVQEMTERIATRIVVQPSGGGSSSVTVAA